MADKNVKFSWICKTYVPAVFAITDLKFQLFPYLLLISFHDLLSVIFTATSIIILDIVILDQAWPLVNTEAQVEKDGKYYRYHLLLSL